LSTAPAPCRRGGALALRPIDLDQCLISLREKGETTRSQPVSPTLMSHLIAHARKRGADATPIGPLLRYRSGVVACLPSGSVFVDDGDVQVVRGACTPHRSPGMDQALH
jgi:hypothetical protein